MISSSVLVEKTICVFPVLPVVIQEHFGEYHREHGGHGEKERKGLPR